jgi:hypothetical protein
MKYELYERERVKNIYIISCLLVFFALIPLGKIGYNGWLNELIVGFSGGTLLSYIAFCFRHRLPVLGGANFEWWEALAPLTLVLLSGLLVAGILWTLASGGKPIVIIGVLLSQPIFQITYEAWWDKKQEADLKREIARDTEEKIFSAIANLREELFQEKPTKNREKSEQV